MAMQIPLFRIFISSSFQDFRAERDLLQKEVFPRLREFCRRNGAQFQPIDLRWGISEAAGENQQTMDICLEELYRCQRITPRPNFILLLGDRYGWQPLPSAIFDDEFQRLLIALDAQKDTEGAVLLKRWYKLDENAIPLERVLQPRGEGFDEATLRGVLQRAAAGAFSADDPRRSKYFDAATHQEIRHGALNADRAEEHVFCYLRKIGQLPDANDKEGRRFIDAVGQKQPDGTTIFRHDADAHRRVIQLKDELAHKFGDTDPPNAHIYELEGREAIPGYLPQFAKDVEEDLQRIIHSELERLKVSDAEAPEAEARLHTDFGAERSRHFTGRDYEIRQIESYVADATNRQPIVISGQGGSGKTALMAEAAMRLRSSRQPPIVISRHLGSTPAASDIRSLLQSVCEEIKQRYPQPASQSSHREEPQTEQGQANEAQRLYREFDHCLALSTASRPLVLLLDALDQLNATEGAHYLGWIPWHELPAHTKLVVSVLKPDDEQAAEPGTICYRAATGRVPAENVLSLSAMSREQGAELLDKWLARAGRRLEAWEYLEIAGDQQGVRRAGRTLTDVQRDDLLDKFALNGLPLWLKLAFEEARHWKSYDGLPVGHDNVPGLPPDVAGILRDLFFRLEQPQKHGELFTRRALGYLAAGRRGLSEEELIDVLSSDKQVMKDFVARSKTEREKDKADRVKQLPVLIWSRLYSDLEPYLSERAAYGGTVLNFYHRQVADEVRKKYLVGDDEIHCHRKLRRFFGNHKRKPYFLESLEEQRKRMRPPYSARPVDVRKVDELPYHVLQVAKLVGKDNPNAPEWDAVADLLTDWNFLEAKNEAGQ